MRANSFFLEQTAYIAFQKEVVVPKNTQEVTKIVSFVEPVQKPQPSIYLTTYCRHNLTISLVDTPTCEVPCGGRKRLSVVQHSAYYIFISFCVTMPVSKTVDSFVRLIIDET